MLLTERQKQVVQWKHKGISYHQLHKHPHRYLHLGRNHRSNHFFGSATSSSQRRALMEELATATIEIEVQMVSLTGYGRKNSQMKAQIVQNH
jgi:hypothetical protein